MSDPEASFAERIRARYPEGLTGIIAVGGTRTHYIMQRNRQSENPGVIADFSAYMDHALAPTLQLIESFLELGGQNLIIPLFSYQQFSERGPEYAAQAANMCLRVIDDAWLNFYREHDLDPYFVGIDTLLHLPTERPEYALAKQLSQFQQRWVYQPGKRKLIWEVASIPLFSIWQAHQVLGEAAANELQNTVSTTFDLESLHQQLARYYSRAMYGTDIPTPHFYLGTNRNGDLKLRAFLPIALLCGGPFRLFYTPYPSLFTTREALQVILEDLAFGKPLNSANQVDYAGKYTSDLIEAEYQRIVKLVADPRSTTGLIRQAGENDEAEM